MENASSAQLPEKLNAEEYDLVILGGGTGSTTGSIFAFYRSGIAPPDKQVEELMQQVIAGRELLFQQGYPDQSPVQKAIRKLVAKLDVTSADNGQNTRQNSTIPFSL
jgi:hypothetical protein